MNKRLIIDGNYVLHKSFHIFRNFRTKGGEFTGTAYGVVRDVLNLVQRYESNDVHIAWDSRSFRKGFAEEYKAQRVREEGSNPYENINLVHDLIDAIGWAQYKIDDMESDDICYSLTLDGKDSIIYSKDKDLHQALRSNVSIIKSPKEPEYTLESFEKEYGFPFNRDNFIFYKCIVGDGSDNIKGIARFPKKEIIASFSGNMKSKYKQIIEENAEMVKRNNFLFTLVDIKNLYIKEIIKPNADRIRKIRERTGLNSIFGMKGFKEYVA